MRMNEPEERRSGVSDKPKDDWLARLHPSWRTLSLVNGAWSLVMVQSAYSVLNIKAPMDCPFTKSVREIVMARHQEGATDEQLFLVLDDAVRQRQRGDQWAGLLSLKRLWGENFWEILPEAERRAPRKGTGSRPSSP
jgi:hypothetical protein